MTSPETRVVRCSFDDITVKQPDISIEGHVDFSDAWREDVTRLDIYNLTKETESVIANSGSVIIEAGYEGREAVLREGPVVEVEGIDNIGSRLTRVYVGTGLLDAVDTPFSKLYSTPTSSAKIIQDAVGEVENLAVGSISETIRYEKKCYETNVADVVQSVVRDINGRAYIRDFSVIVDAGDTITETTELRTGKVSRSKLPRETTEVWRIETPLNGSVAESVAVVLDGITYRVIEGTHDLSAWITKVECVQV